MTFDLPIRRGRARRRPLAAVSALVLAALAGCATDVPPEPTDADERDPVVLHGALEPGPYVVGFERVERAVPRGPDTAALVGQPTSMDLYRWYPAAAAGATGRAMTYADYYGAERALPWAPDELGRRLRGDMTSPPALTDEAIEEVLAAALWARAGAPAAEGVFPLVLWSYRDSIPTMQPVLAEYLASHGYVVLFGWPRDNLPPAPWDQSVDHDGRLEALATQVDLLAAILDAAAQEPSVDVSRTAVLAWSYGGESAHGLARRRDEVAVVIGIDANLASGWVYQDAAALERIPAADLKVPYVLLRHGRPRRGADETPAPDLLARVPAGAWYVRLPRLRHGNFNFPGGMLPGVLGLEEVSDWAAAGPDAALGYEVVSRLVLGFVERAVAGDPMRAPRQLGSVPPGFAEVVRYPHEGPVAVDRD